MTTQPRDTHDADRRAAGGDRDAIVEAIKRLWNAVKERLLGDAPAPAPAPAPVRVPVRGRR
ncbi:MAG TPA: hypothetical protein VEI02_08510 [Planctomycetota bacterium]|nr:hypothetical protein [Planctomycetota bacterium]